jgi:diguanylate cyclase (GGDEF)-like protein
MEISSLDNQRQGGKPATKITVSIGVNTREYGNNITVDEFFSTADGALYTAKNKGRNKVFHPSAVL